jgi:hypothetical protein
MSRFPGRLRRRFALAETEDHAAIAEILVEQAGGAAEDADRSAGNRCADAHAGLVRNQFPFPGLVAEHSLDVRPGPTGLVCAAQRNGGYRGVLLAGIRLAVELLGSNY